MTSSMNDMRAFVVLGLMLMIFAIVATALMGLASVEMVTTASRGQAGTTVPEWLRDQQAIISPGLTVNGHAAKHRGETLDAWKIYALLLEGQCVASTVWCGPSSAEKLYLCVDPSGLIGGIFVFGNEIRGGFGARARYWELKLDSPTWEVCQ